MAGDADVRVAIEANSGDLPKELERSLLIALKTNTPPNDSVSLDIAARDSAGTLIGGMAGTTAYGWLLVKILWVAQAHRSRGIGAQIMRAAEAEAYARGCHGAWLETSSARAAALYRRLGYAPFGELENKAGERPAGHRRVFLCKRFVNP